MNTTFFLGVCKIFINVNSPVALIEFDVMYQISKTKFCMCSP